MACAGQLTPLTLTAGAGLLQNVALGISPSLTNVVSQFGSLDITSTFSNIVSAGSGLLEGSVLNDLRTMGADIFPALTNALPGINLVGADIFSAISSIGDGLGVAPGGLTGLITDTAAGIMGSGDLSIFGQIYNTASGYLGQANEFINANLNLSGLSSTFGNLTGGMDNLITGSFNQISQAFGTLGSDLADLGQLINLNNLPNLGDPSALIQQLSSVGGLVPGVESALRDIGFSSSDLVNFASGQFPGLTESANKLLYSAMTNITGSELNQVMNVLGVSTPGITNMADLLNPQKILPNSFSTLTMPTPDGLLAIYTASGGINTNIEKFLQDPNAPEYTGDDPIVRARLGLPPLEPDGGSTA